MLTRRKFSAEFKREAVGLVKSGERATSQVAIAGIQGRGLQALLGHKDSRMTMRYPHLSEEYLREKVHQLVLG